MAEEIKVDVQYIDSALAAANGSRPFPMGLRLAQEYEGKGWVKILNRPPQANPSLPISSTEKRENAFVKMPEEENLTKVAWISPEYVEAVVRKIGYNLGYKVEHYSPATFPAGRLVDVKLLIVESNLRGFTSNQLANLRAIQFQKTIPFVFRVVSYDNSQHFQQNLIHSKLNIFVSAQVFDYVSELHENLIGDWFIENKADHYVFWRKIEEAVFGKKIAPEVASEVVLEPVELAADTNIDSKIVIPERPRSDFKKLKKITKKTK